MSSLIPEDLTQPGTHALIIGVSAYLHFADGVDPTPNGTEFEMEQLSAAACSASEFAAWLINEYKCDRAPLRSLRVLLSPSEGEKIHADIKALLKGDFSATLNNVKIALNEFKAACDSNPKNVLIVYVVGHGIQLSKHGTIVLLHDIGAAAHVTKLEGAIDMAGVHAGMNHPNTASTQFWFVDACRQKPAIARRFEALKGALTLDEPAGNTETAPMFLAATPGKAAFARVGGFTLFNEALMWVLRGGGAVGPDPDHGINNWHISVTALIKHLPERLKTLGKPEGVEPPVDIAPPINEAIFHEYAAAPKVDLRVDLLPEAAKSVSKGSLKFNASVPIVKNYSAWPLHQSVDAGLYLLNIKTSNPYKPKKDIILDLKPPEKHAEYDMAV